MMSINKRIVLLAAGIGLGLFTLAGAAWAYWTAQAANVPAVSRADSVATGAQPTANLAGSTATVTWAAATTVGGRQVSGYLINRYPTATGGTAVAAAHGGCAAVPVAATSCTETAVPAGTWYYTVTPVLAAWHGPESPRANAITATDTFTLTPSGGTTLTAGTASTVTITATTAGQTDTVYSGAKTLVFSGPGTAPNGTVPLYANGNTSVTFTGGVASVPMTLFRAETPTLTVSGPNASGSIALTVNPGNASGFAVSTGSTRTAGTPQPVTVTAQDAYQNTATGYSGTKTLTWSGPGTALTGQVPSYPANPVTFTAGIASNLPITCFLAQTVTLTVRDGTNTGTSAPFTVQGAAATQLAMTQPGSPTAGTAFALTVSALDAYQNQATGYSGAKTLTFSGPNAAPAGQKPSYPANPVTFAANGTATVSITLVSAETTTLKVSDGTLTATTASITVSPGAPANLAWTSVSATNGTVSQSCLFTCTVSGIGPNKSFNAKVSVTDALGNTVNNAGGTITVRDNSAATVATLTVPATGPATSPSFTYTTPTGNWTSVTLTATDGGYAAAIATLTR
ncbi:hypothetical protein [Kutzneria buriramensis]|uniref:Fibronectin type-III domain-containing protein n=1 Tax=Kutzneria buriramensis TaxID=1045776 RepID=A0A3E0H946_9PSEU|nr:hypothetical protein [Kutzneria buriramensis]REH39366.1 hypothetical protein BCF44_113221 [Kutzneria buriramensis]